MEYARLWRERARRIETVVASILLAPPVIGRYALYRMERTGKVR